MDNIVKNLMFKDRNVTVLSRESEILFDPKEIGEILLLSERSIEDKILSLEDGLEKMHLSRIQVESMFQGTEFSRTLSNFGKTYLTEAGMYRFVIESSSPTAKDFKKWICSEVLPSIRKHGIYATPQTVEQMLSNPDLLIEALQKLKQERKEKEEALLAKEKAERERLWIRSKAEATAMATASAKSRELDKLKLEMGEHKEYASILRVALATNTSEKEYNYRVLKNYSLTHGLEIHEISDPRFGKARTYHREAWYNMYGVDLEELF